ncbi:MAG: acetate--CoA ligase family protein [Candidatus Woesebacteria bacterium]|jgi:acetyltransferase
MKNLEALFYPKSIAIIGASSREKTVGNDVVKNLVQQGYQGEIYPVNRKIDQLYGKKVYPDISEVDKQIDLVVVAIPAKFVPEVVKVAASKGAKAAIVISAGFKESGNLELEQELKQICDENNIALVGPNCLGMINPEIKMNASFAALMPAKGNVAFMSQSGALCTAVLDYAEDLDVGFSKFISLGNKADLDELTLIEYLANDEQTKVIAMYVEELKDAPKIIETMKRINRGPNPKPVIVLKSGRTEAGAGAIASHTGSLSGGDAAYNALFDQSGMVRARDIKELFDLAQVFAKNDITPVKKVTIITNAGGPGVLTTDEVVASGLQLTKLSLETEQALKKALPAAASTNNPVDILGDARADRYKAALEIVAKDKNTDAILVLLTPQSMTEIEKTAQAVIETRNESKKPMAVSFMGRPTVRPGVKMLGQAAVAATSFPEPAASSMAAFAKFVNWKQIKTGKLLAYDDVDKEKVKQIFDQARSTNKKSFPEAEALAILGAYNFPLLKSKIAKNAEEAERISQEFGSELAMKIVSPDILHKSDVGGVVLNVTAQDAKEKFEAMMKTVAANKPDAKLEGALMMEMAPSDGTELILGISKAPGLGTMIMLGLGGIYVEVFKDVSFSIAPVTKNDAIRMIQSLKSAKIFEGVRGQEARDIDKIIECIGRLSQLVTDFPDIVELDINPLLALAKGQGVKVLDARIVIE